MPKTILKTSHVQRAEEVFRVPRVIAYNRLEARPRMQDFTRSLSAEVRDPLWMLTRQWQFGEFAGEDAASPVTSRIAYHHEAISRISLAKGKVDSFYPEPMPLEAKVERERVPFTVRELGVKKIYSDVVFAIQLGKQFQRMLKASGLQIHNNLYVSEFQIQVLPVQAEIENPSANPPESVEDKPPRSIEDVEAEQIRTAVTGNVADGVAIWRSIQDGTHDSWLDTKPGGDKPAIKAIAVAFGQWCSKKFQRLFTTPDQPADSAWLPEHLEYQFAIGGQPRPDGRQTVLTAEQYPGGRLDWFSFDIATNQTIDLDDEAEPVEQPEQVESFLPGPVRFKGQPRARFWELEENETDFGKIDTSPSGLLHLMLAEFGLIYSNDWFMLPHPMEINNVCEVRGILVDDTFGRHTFIRPAGREPETAWQRWAMFHHTETGQSWPSSSRFYLVPAVGKLIESEPLERVNFMRDEMANMVWGVECIIPSQTGIGMSGYGSSQPDDSKKRRESTKDDVKIAYELGTMVPKNWIPFIPVHAEGSISEIRLQRARMAGGKAPRGRLLREPRSPYFIEEEEVPRAGIYVERSWQRTRWLGGRTVIWVGRRKTAGKGEGWSKLVFDQIVDLQLKKP